VELEDYDRQLLIIFSGKWVDGVKGNKNYIVFIDGKLKLQQAYVYFMKIQIFC